MSWSAALTLRGGCRAGHPDATEDRRGAGGHRGQDGGGGTDTNKERIYLGGQVHVSVKAQDENTNVYKLFERRVNVYDSAMDRFLAEGRLVIGVHTDSFPGGFCYPSSDARQGFSGFDIELSEHIARELSKSQNRPYVRPIFVYYEWSDLLRQPARGTVDFAIASISITKEREQKFQAEFSVPYLKTPVALVTPSSVTIDTRQRASIERLRLGVHSDTTEQAAAQLLGLNPIVEPNNADLFVLLKTGHYDAVLYDEVRGRALVARDAALAVRSIDFQSFGVAIEPEGYGIMFRKGEDKLRPIVNDIIARLQSSEFGDPEVHLAKRFR